jgi:hypothetical protein
MLIASSIVVFYVLSYAVLSLTGGWVVSESGMRRWNFGLATADILIWQPRYGACQWFIGVDGSGQLRGTKLGYFYTPLILLDQRFVHRTIVFVRPDGSMIESFPKYEEYHPLIKSRFHGRFPYIETPAEGTGPPP